MEKVYLAEGNPRAVICVESGLLYDSIEDASRELRISAIYLERCLKGKTGTAGGYHWRYENSDSRDQREKKSSNLKRRGDLFAVKNLDSGKEYESLREAFEDTGIGASNIYQCVTGRWLTAGGYHWEYVDEERREQAKLVREQRFDKKKVETAEGQGGGKKEKSGKSKGLSEELILDLGDVQFDLTNLESRAQTAWKAERHVKGNGVRTCEMYVRPDEGRAYWVINGTDTGSLEL